MGYTRFDGTQREERHSIQRFLSGFSRKFLQKNLQIPINSNKCCHLLTNNGGNYFIKGPNVIVEHGECCRTDINGQLEI